jgi:type IV secretory pathway VirD2 relaxase
MSDLKTFARDLVGQMEKDLGAKLDWVAVDHWNL